MLASLRQLDRILRGETTRLSALRDGVIDLSVRQLSGALLVLGMVYGLCMGLFSVIASGGTSYWQMLATTVKVPALFFLTLLVTFPSLYVFNALVGSRLSLLSMLRLLVAAMSVMLAVLASFGTIVAFFSLSSKSYSFVVLMNVAVFALSGLLGLLFLLRTLHRLTISQTPPPLPPLPAIPVDPQHDAPPLVLSESALDQLDSRPMGSQVRVVFRIWILLFGVVGAQMGWVLRPFIGNPNVAFTFFRPRGSNFFEAVFRALFSLMGW